MVRFIEFEILEREGQKVTIKIRSVKWGVELKEIDGSTAKLKRGNGRKFNSGIENFSIKSMVGTDITSEALYLHGSDEKYDEDTESYYFKTEERAIEVFEGLLSMATNAEDFIDPSYLQGYTPEKICIDEIAEPQNKSAWEYCYPLSLYSLRTPPQPDNASLTQGMKWVFNSTTNAWEQKPKRDHDYINELMHAEKARDYMGVYNGMDLGSNESVQTEGFDYTQGVIWQALKELRKHTPVFSTDWGSNDIPKANNKIKGEEKMNLRKEEKLTVEQAVEKFDLANAYIEYNEPVVTRVKYYNNGTILDFYSMQKNGETQVWTEYKEKDENGIITEIRYIIEEGNDFIQKLNFLKPFDKMKMLEKYAEKPKFTLGEKVIYTKTDVNLSGAENDYPEELKKQILQKRIESTKQIGIITKIQYIGNGAIVYDLLTNKYGGLTVGADNLTIIKE